MKLLVILRALGPVLLRASLGSWAFMTCFSAKSTSGIPPPKKKNKITPKLFLPNTSNLTVVLSWCCVGISQVFANSADR